MRSPTIPTRFYERDPLSQQLVASPLPVQEGVGKNGCLDEADLRIGDLEGWSLDTPPHGKSPLLLGCSCS